MAKNTSKENQNHDGAYKKIFTHPEMVESLIRDFVPEEWVNDIDFSTLELPNKGFVTDELRSREDDIIWKVRWRDSWLYVYLIIEFQSSVDHWMAVRTMVYTGLLYQDLIASGIVQNGEKLPPVFPLVLYNGLGTWTARREIADLIAPMPPSLRRYRPRHQYFLVDEGRIPDEQLNDRLGLSAILVRLERARGPEELQAGVKELIENLNDPRYLSLRRALSVWVRRLLIGRLKLDQPIPEVYDLQEVNTMLAERMTQWTENWLEQGELRGQSKLLQRMLFKRFGSSFDFRFQERLRNASPEQVERWADRFVDAKSLEDVFDDKP